jgi:hypothetical protein
MFTEIFTTGLGWIYLKIRYRTASAMQSALNEKYDGSYSAAAGIVAIKFFVIVLMILIVLLLLALVVSMFRFGIK